MLILFRFGGEGDSTKILIASMAFVLPAIPLSALGGEIADSHDKALVARGLKLAEIGVQIIGATGFVLSSLSLLYLALFGLGTAGARVRLAKAADRTSLIGSPRSARAGALTKRRRRRSS